MRRDLTHITLVVDRSGSMKAIREDAEGGINSFIDMQRKSAGDATLSLVQFDTEFEFVHRYAPLESVPRFELVPRGMTALLDAVGGAIKKTHRDLKRIPEEERPGLVTFVVMTDGLENASHSYTRDRVRKMIEKRKTKNGWTFLFLGANQDAFAEAAAMGIDRDHAAGYSARSTRLTYDAMSRKLAHMRACSTEGRPFETAFTDEEREEMK